MNKLTSLIIILGFIIYTIVNSIINIPEKVLYIFKGIIILGALYFLIFEQNIGGVIRENLKNRNNK